MFKVLAVMALRNLFAHKVKSLFVGALMAFGTFVFVFGTAMLDSVQGTMTESITSSMAGHLQIYDKDAKDKLALFGSGFMAADDVGHIDDFAKVKEIVEGLPGVKAVVPMGLGFSMTSSPSQLDRTLTELRTAQAGGPARAADAGVLRARVRELATQIGADLELSKKLAADQEKLARHTAIVQRATSDQFWQEYAADPAAGIEWLDLQLGPAGGEGWLYYLRYVGTDPSTFAKRFDRFELVEGEMIPEGKRGFLFNKNSYDKFIKHPVARSLDKVFEEVTVKGKRIADDPSLKERIARNSRAYRKVVEQLSPPDAAALLTELRRLLPEVQGELPELVQAYLLVDDDSLAARHAHFHEHIAPRIRLYEFRPGDVITLRGFSKSGYMRAVNVPVYGVFNFRGMERSDLAGGQHLVDLMSFRDLYGLMTTERRAELDAMKAGVGITDLNAADAEAALFGGGDSAAAAAAPDAQGRDAVAFDEFARVDIKRGSGEQIIGGDYTRAELESGVALNVAVILDDPDDLWPQRQKVQDALTAAGLNLQVVDWRTASGMVGQYIVAIRVVLYIAIFIIFLVAVVIINNSMVMATMERIQEIGAMRAIGARRRFVLTMFLMETLTLGVLAGAVGAAAAAALVTFLGVQGIPAPHDVLVFLFGGPRLHPSFGIGNLAVGLVAVVVVSLASTLYPARIAARVQPIVAMSPRE